MCRRNSQRFKDPGKKIATAAKVFAIMGIVISILLGVGNIVSSIVTGISIMTSDLGRYANAEGFMVFLGILFIFGGFVIGVIILAAGCFLSWLGGLFIISYGELVSDTKALKEKIVGVDIVETTEEPITE